MGTNYGMTMNAQHNYSFSIDKLQKIEDCAPFVIWKD
jgi:hypothetical protein